MTACSSQNGGCKDYASHEVGDCYPSDDDVGPGPYILELDQDVDDESIADAAEDRGRGEEDNLPCCD